MNFEFDGRELSTVNYQLLYHVIYLLIINYHSTNLITRLLQSLPPEEKIDYEVVIVNNSPQDLSLQQLKGVTIIEAKDNLGFGGGCNLGLNWIYERDKKAIAKGSAPRCAWLLNPDTYLPANTLEKVPQCFARNPQLSLLGTVIYTENGDIWFAGGRFLPHLGAIFSAPSLLAEHPATEELIPCDWISGCSLLINLDRFSSCPQFDPAYFLYYEDFDFCRRYVSQGHELAITRELAIIHQPSSITNRNIAKKIEHSTYSYLLTLQKYTNPVIFLLRFLRLSLHGFLILPLKPQVSFGKLAGISSYLTSYFKHRITG